MIHELYCSGHIMRFKSAAGCNSLGKHFCDGCQTKLVRHQVPFVFTGGFSDRKIAEKISDVENYISFIDDDL